MYISNCSYSQLLIGLLALSRLACARVSYAAPYYRHHRRHLGGVASTVLEVAGFPDIAAVVEGPPDDAVVSVAPPPNDAVVTALVPEVVASVVGGIGAVSVGIGTNIASAVADILGPLPTIVLAPGGAWTGVGAYAASAVIITNVPGPFPTAEITGAVTYTDILGPLHTEAPSSAVSGGIGVPVEIGISDSASLDPTVTNATIDLTSTNPLVSATVSSSTDAVSPVITSTSTSSIDIGTNPIVSTVASSTDAVSSTPTPTSTATATPGTDAGTNLTSSTAVVSSTVTSSDSFVTTSSAALSTTTPVASSVLSSTSSSSTFSSSTKSKTQKTRSWSTLSVPTTVSTVTYASTSISSSSSITSIPTEKYSSIRLEFHMLTSSSPAAAPTYVFDLSTLPANVSANTPCYDEGCVNPKSGMNYRTTISANMNVDNSLFAAGAATRGNMFAAAAVVCALWGALVLL